MAERYFPEIQFTIPGPLPPELIEMHEGKEHDLNSQTGVIVNSSTDLSPSPFWTKKGLISTYKTVLEIMESRHRVELPIHNRYLSIVPRKDLVPDDPQLKDNLAASYGEDFLGFIVGLTQRKPDGSFRIRIGYEGEDTTVPESEVLGVLAHELGHTYGKHINKPPVEELKAFTFQSAFMETYTGLPFRLTGRDLSSVHDTARHRLAQLLDMGIDYHETLAHLTGRRFGLAFPNDYKKYLTN